MSSLDRFELFGDLVEDIKELLISTYLPPLSSLLLAMTSKQYHLLAGPSVRNLLTLTELSRAIGKLGSKSVFIFFDELGWELNYDSLLRESISSASMEILNLFLLSPPATFTYRDKTVKIADEPASYFIGESGSDLVEQYFLHPNGGGGEDKDKKEKLEREYEVSVIDLNHQFYLNGLAVSGDLEKLKKAVAKMMMLSTSSIRFLVLCAFEFMHDEMLEWIVSEFGVTFREGGFASILPESMFFVEIRETRYLPDPSLYLRGIKFLEKHNADMTSDRIISECIYGNAMEACIYLENKYQSLTKLKTIEMDSLFEAGLWSAFDTLLWVLDKKPSLIAEYIDRFYGGMVYVIMNDNFTTNAIAFRKRIREKYYRKILAVLKLAEEKLTDSVRFPDLFTTDSVRISDPFTMGLTRKQRSPKWIAVCEMALASLECNEFLECIFLLCQRGFKLIPDLISPISGALAHSKLVQNFSKSGELLDLLKSMGTGESSH